jgi:hypothetical protein
MGEGILQWVKVHPVDQTKFTIRCEFARLLTLALLALLRAKLRRDDPLLPLLRTGLPLTTKPSVQLIEAWRLTT